ncbi:hypothetical protein A606_00915 [Corynebacterium terpenotabidum Y-11]|uniref:Uncharacterized protein n=1 Tax=Corynebacterium terpenotabidum Y-11 TaxID=1200352 RepID=S4XGQ6_9CORY|nr:hypothetical protein A606_00915 [Corynebacterium terpenotabidum Y-11]
MAPAASAETVYISDTDGRWLCDIHEDYVVGPLRGGPSVGNCRTHVGEFWPGSDGISDSYSLGQYFLLDGTSFTASIDKVW